MVIGCGGVGGVFLNSLHDKLTTWLTTWQSETEKEGESVCVCERERGNGIFVTLLKK